MATCCMTILHYEMMAMVEVYWQMTRTYMPSVRVVIENVESKPFARTFQTICGNQKLSVLLKSTIWLGHSFIPHDTQELHTRPLFRVVTENVERNHLQTNQLGNSSYVYTYMHVVEIKTIAIEWHSFIQHDVQELSSCAA
jgi:hypothetical protein